MKDWFFDIVTGFMDWFLELGWAFLIVAAIIAFCVGAVVYVDRQKELVEMPMAYKAWVKQTDNPKNLSYEEWRALVRASEHQSGSTIIPIYVHQ